MTTHLKYQNLSKSVTPKNFPGRSKYFIQIWYIVNATLFRLSPHALFGWRNFLLRMFGARIGGNVKIRPSCNITYPWNVEIGDYTYIADEAVIYSLDKIKIGSHVSISGRSFICTGTHNHKSLNFDLVTKPITIEDEAWIAADSFIHPGLKIGRGAIVAARSVVTEDVMEAAIVRGDPAKIIGHRRPPVN